MCFLFGEMKLSEYFQQQQSQSLSSQMKSDIFFRIQKEKLIGSTIPSSLNTKRFFVASKHIIYTSLASLIAIIVFGGIILDKKNVIDLGSFSIQSFNPNGVHADFVAEIVEFNGDYSISREDKNGGLDILAQNLIHDGDIIKLKEGTKMTFNLADGTQARIDGPAELSIIKTKKGYQISLIDGKFFRIFCPECVSDIEITTPETSIHQDKNQSLDLQIAKEDGGVLVKNNGDTVSVTTIQNNVKQENNLNSENLAKIDSKNDSINILDDSDLMIAFMQKNNISGTFSLSHDEVDWPEVKQNSVDKVVAKVDDQPIMDKNIKPEISTNYDISGTVLNESEDPILAGIMDVISLTNDEKDVDINVSLELGIEDDAQKVPSEAQMKTLKSSLNSFFLMNIFESIYINDKAEQGISQLADRVNSVAASFEYSDHAQSNLDSIKETALSLQSKIDKNWYISPMYVLQLGKIANWCDVLKNSYEKDRNSFTDNLPINLRLM